MIDYMIMNNKLSVLAGGDHEHTFGSRMAARGRVYVRIDQQYGSSPTTDSLQQYDRFDSMAMAK